ncbi:hypothetical protein LSH36_248g03050 [Paralvinella palmiformis]|uniref:GON-4-like protein n=1 Tax=Paralvinella palmiformis TaxID=53620 RepID=A0AAD9N4W5_9ANNE|nr:hypothetical protein LSH36_248g03050 [Paralvinella palmiformis]
MAKNLLLELKALGDTTEVRKGQSYMKPPNLEEAIQITELDMGTGNPEAEELLTKNLTTMASQRKASLEYPLTYKQMDTLVSSAVFLFPQMLPDYALVAAGSCKKRVAFTHAEDNLLAMGFDQFHQLEKRYLYIHKFLLPTKQREQIRFRHKNLRARHNGQAKCALNYWYENGHLPEFQRYYELEDVADIKAPRYRDPELLPGWYEAYFSTKKQIEQTCQRFADFAELFQYFIDLDITRSCDNDISQQVLDSLMSVITDDNTTSIGSTVIDDVPPMLPVVTVTDVSQQPQSVVMLTTSQLEQLGIKVNVIEPSEVSLNTSTSSQQCVLAATEQSAITSQNICVSQGPSQPGEELNISSQSLISHAFSEATGIPLDNFQSETESKILDGNTTLSEMLSPVVLSEVVMNEDDNNLNTSNIPECNNNDGDDVGEDKDVNDVDVRQSCVDTERTSRVNTVTADKEASVLPSSVGEQNTVYVMGEERCSNDDQGRPADEKSITDPEEPHCLSAASELDPVDVNEASDRGTITAGLKSKETAVEEQQSLGPTSNNKHTDVICEETSVKNTSMSSLVDGHETVSGSPDCLILNKSNDSPVKHTIRVMAELAQLITPPAKISPLKLPHQHRASFMTPHKKSPRKSPLKPLRPLGSVVSSSPVKLNLPKKSLMGRPRLYNKTTHRKDFNKKAQNIAPKGFVVQTYVSPVKLAAASIAAKARRKKQPKPKAVRVLRALLPKTCAKANESIEDDLGIIGHPEIHGFHQFRHQLHREEKMEPDMDSFSETEAGNDSQPDEEQIDEEGEDETDRDEDRLARLMAASTTVRNVAKKSAIGEQKRKKMHKRVALLELLEPDLVENDPRRDERDTAFAQGYLLKVQQALSDQPEQYEKFLKLLYEFGCSDKTPVQLYFSMKDLLKDHLTLLSDFAGFLMPDQAKVCGCLMEHINFKKCREFLRKLEIYFSKQPHTLQRVIKAFAQWQNSSHSDPTDLMATVKPLLKGQPYLLDEFTKFFDNEKPPESSNLRFYFSSISFLCLAKCPEVI